MSQVNKTGVVLLSGPTCSGKTTLEKALHVLGLQSVISFTTRPPSGGEMDGVDYHFRTSEWVDQQSAAGAVIEISTYGGHRYGVTRDSIEIASARSPCLVSVVDPNGMRSFADLGKRTGAFEIFSVLLEPPREVLLERFLRRFAEDQFARPEIYAARLRQMVEFEFHWQFAYSRCYDLVVNSASTSEMDGLVAAISQFAAQRGTPAPLVANWSQAA